MFASTILALAATLAAPAPKVPPRAEAGKIEGDWVVEKYVEGGKENPKRKGMHLSADEDEIAVREEAGATVSYTLDPEADPPGIDLVAAAVARGGYIRGIYKVDGDTLTLCFPKGGKGERPARFESPDGSEVVLMTLKRAKKD